MSCRTLTFALSKHNLEAYQNARQHLKDTIDVFQHMKVGVKGDWKPCQTGVKSCTQGILDLAELYVEKKGIRYFLPGLCTTDFVENEFSVFRSRDKVLTPLQVKTAVKAISVSQFLQPVPKSNYNFDDRAHLIDLFENRKATFPETSLENQTREPESIEDEHWTDADDISAPDCSLLQNVPRSAEVTEPEKYVLYRVAGYISRQLISEKNKAMACADCALFSRHQGPESHPYSALLKLTNFKEDVLVEPCEALFQLTLEAENKFISIESRLPLLDTDVFALAKDTLTPLIEHAHGFPSCHSLAEEFIIRFIRMRLRFFFLSQRLMQQVLRRRISRAKLLPVII